MFSNTMRSEVCYWLQAKLTSSSIQRQKSKRWKIMASIIIDNSNVSPAVNFCHQWLIEPYVPDEFIFINCRPLVQEVYVRLPLVTVHIYRHVAYMEGCKILKEVGPLAGIDTILVKA